MLSVKSRFIILDLFYVENGFDQFLWNGMGVLSLTGLELLMSLAVATLGEPSPTLAAVEDLLFGVNSQMIHHTCFPCKSDVADFTNQNLVISLSFLVEFLVNPVKILDIILPHAQPQLFLKLLGLLRLLGDLFFTTNFCFFWSH